MIYLFSGLCVASAIYLAIEAFKSRRFWNKHEEQMRYRYGSSVPGPHRRPGRRSR